MFPHNLGLVVENSPTLIEEIMEVTNCTMKQVSFLVQNTSLEMAVPLTVEFGVILK